MLKDKNLGKLIVFSAPSGAGKTSIVHFLLNEIPELEFSVSACSRLARKNEIDGKDYYFLTEGEFRSKIRENAFLEWEEVYEGNFYGTLVSELDRIFQKGHHVVFDIDVKGGLNIKSKFPEQTLSIFVMPPSEEVLEHRLRNRGSDSEEIVRKRMAKASYELSFASQFDYILINDDLEKARREALQLIKQFIYQK